MGAEGPKGYAAAIVAIDDGAGRDRPAIRRGLVGSMPVIDRPRAGLSTSAGRASGSCSSGLRPDMAIVLKPGYAASYERSGAGSA
jgi:hypothetical protein